MIKNIQNILHNIEKRLATMEKVVFKDSHCSICNEVDCAMKKPMPEYSFNVAEQKDENLSWVHFSEYGPELKESNRGYVIRGIVDRRDLMNITKSTWSVAGVNYIVTDTGSFLRDMEYFDNRAEWLGPLPR